MTSLDQPTSTNARHSLSGEPWTSACASEHEFQQFLCSVFIARWRPGTLDGPEHGRELGHFLSGTLVALRTAAQKVLPDAGRERVSLPRYKLRRVLELVDRRIDERLTVHEMAQVAEMSVYHFSRKFKECTGLAPHQYVRHCRMKIAADMLANSDESIAIIARRVGCSDQSHFTGVFKRVFCTTPADFRRKRREIEAGSS